VVADVRHDFVNTVNKPLDSIDTNTMTEIFAAQKKRGDGLVQNESVTISNSEYRHSADIQFIGQTHLLNVPVHSAQITTVELQKRFEEVYYNRFHVELNEIRANLVNLNTTVIGARPELDLKQLIDPDKRQATLEAAKITQRKIWFNGEWYETPIYSRELLPADTNITGPAVIEQMDCTILIEPMSTATSDADGNLIVEISQ